MSNNVHGNVFDLDASGVLDRLGHRLLGLHRLQKLCAGLSRIENPAEFARAALERLGASFEVHHQEQFRIPAEGPAVVVANHPFGGLEALFLIRLLRCIRSDVKFLANFHLLRIPALKESFIPVNPFGGRKAARGNAARMLQALRWVKGGGLLVVFPAGEVAHLDPRRGGICEPHWSATAARLIRMTGASVVPVHFSGRDSMKFQLAGLVHPYLRTALLPRELMNKQGIRIPVRIGEPIPSRKLAGMDDDDMLAEHLRLRTCMLGAVEKGAIATTVSAASAATPSKQLQPVAAAVPLERIAAEIARLPADQCLSSSSEFQVYHASAQQAPWLLQEIGRLRELTFRTVGEGTGRASDIDLYDDYYQHLFVWNTDKQELVGAYRLGHADTIVKRLGKRGLYTSTLFDYRGPILRQLSPALELGRSFIRPEYQRSFTALMLLWKGIGEYVVRHPRYSVLFGAVSISNDYAALSKEMLVNYLRKHNYATSLARWVKARNPFRGRLQLRTLTGELNSGTLDMLSSRVSDIEADGKGVPILLRQYLKLGGRMLGFNVDPSFAHSIDCLIMVDLREADARVLNKYMGQEGAQTFLRHHGAARDVAEAG